MDKIDLSRVFYANGIGFTFNLTEAVLIFRYRPIEQSPEGEVEVARVHLPRNVAHNLLTVMAKDYEKKFPPGQNKQTQGGQIQTTEGQVYASKP